MTTVIKAGEVPRLTRPPTSVDLSDHLAGARDVVDGARRRAARILADARSKARSLELEARERGYAEGIQRGWVAGEANGNEAARLEASERFAERCADVVAAMEATVREIQAMKGDLAIAAERDLLSVALSVVRQLTFSVGLMSSESALANLRRVLSLVARQTDLVVYVHPRDLDSMKEHAPALLAAVSSGTGVEFVEDSAMAPGGCRVTTPRTDIDATLETQVAEVVALMTGTRTGEGTLEPGVPIGEGDDLKGPHDV